jgi:hypothetical protein
MLIVALLEEWRGEERKRIYPLKVDRQDELNPTDEPNLTLNESAGRRKVCPDFFKPARWLGAKIVLPRTPHVMNECSNRPLV